MRKRYLVIGCFAVFCLVLVAALGRCASGARARPSEEPSISADGRYVAFRSDGGIFVHDRQTGQATRVSVGLYPSISAEGRHVAFQSTASKMVPGDTNGKCDIFVHDRQTGQTERVSVASDGTQGNGGSAFPSISADGRYIAFISDATNLVPGDTNDSRDVFVHDRQTGETVLVSVASDGTQANARSGDPSISADGRYVAFPSWASNLVPGDTNNTGDILVHDRQTRQTTRVSVASDGTEGDGWSGDPSISADGRYVAFGSGARNLVPGDTNNTDDIFVHDRQTGQTTCVSLTSEGAQGDKHSTFPSISADGRYVAFRSDATNLVPGDTNDLDDIFVHDRQTGQTTCVSVASDGTQGERGSRSLWVDASTGAPEVFGSRSPSISADGRYVAFESDAINLVPDDPNYWDDIFVHDQQTGQTTRVSAPSERPWWRKIF